MRPLVHRAAAALWHARAAVEIDASQHASLQMDCALAAGANNLISLIQTKCSRMSLPRPSRFCPVGSQLREHLVGFHGGCIGHDVGVHSKSSHRDELNDFAIV